MKKCKITLGNIFGDNNYKTNAVALLLKCSYCGKYHGYAIDGVDRYNMDVDFLISQMS